MQDNILWIFPNNKTLKEKWWHRLALVLWGISFLPIAFYVLSLTQTGFSFKILDFLGLIAFGYFAVPLTYRTMLYITKG